MLHSHCDATTTSARVTMLMKRNCQPRKKGKSHSSRSKSRFLFSFLFFYHHHTPNRLSIDLFLFACALQEEDEDGYDSSSSDDSFVPSCTIGKGRVGGCLPCFEFEDDAVVIVANKFLSPRYSPMMQKLMERFASLAKSKMPKHNQTVHKVPLVKFLLDRLPHEYNLHNVGNILAFLFHAECYVNAITKPTKDSVVLRFMNVFLIQVFACDPIVYDKAGKEVEREEVDPQAHQNREHAIECLGDDFGDIVCTPEFNLRVMERLERTLRNSVCPQPCDMRVPAGTA